MQTIFLMEAFTLYKSRRSSQRLSGRFLRMYEMVSSGRDGGLWPHPLRLTNSQLASKPSARTKADVDELANITPTSDDARVFQQWSAWTDSHAWQRLLLACVVLEAQQAVLLAREPVSAITADIELPIPTRMNFWEAEDARSWATSILENTPQTIYIRDVLENPSIVLPQGLDTFQSAVLIAGYDNMFFSSIGSPTSPFLGPFGQLTQASSFLPILSPDSATQTYYHISELVHNAPRRALLAVSGESWVYSSRLSTNATQAGAEFASLKLELRKWADDTEIPGQETIESEQPREKALLNAIRVLRLAADRGNLPQEPWLFGGEIAVYISTLVLWALCSRALQRTLPFNFSMSTDLSGEGPFFSQNAISDFLRRAESDIAAGGEIKGWREGVRAVIISTKGLLRGNETDEKQIGELFQGCVGVLDKLWRKGWDEPWF